MRMPAQEFELIPEQNSLLATPVGEKIFLHGPAGSGKTTAGVARMLAMLDAGIPGGSILILAPQRTLARPYTDVLRNPGLNPGGTVNVLTIGGLARRMVDLFWPAVAAEAGFSHPDELPTFLTLETAQYYLAHLLRPLLEEGMFDLVTIDRNRLFSQVLDNINKSAVVGFPLTEIGTRLKSAWAGDPGQVHVYDDVQRCADIFRAYCLDHNLLDFSLQIEVFRDFLWPSSTCREYLSGMFRHIIYDNVEEDAPISHDILRGWAPSLESALLVYDWDAGYRRFLGADPRGAFDLKDLCTQEFVFEKSLVTSPQIASLGVHLASNLTTGTHTVDVVHSQFEVPNQESPLPSPKLALEFAFHRFYPQNLDWVAERIRGLVLDEGVPPGEIVVMAPYLSDALRFSLNDRLMRYGIPSRSHRPSRSLREEPATKTLLTLSTLSHPHWGIQPSKFDIAYAMMGAIADLDLVRANLLTDNVYKVIDGVPSLSQFETVRPEVQERLTYRIGERYEGLRYWLQISQRETVKLEGEFDHFLSRLFGEVLSQPGYGFHADYDAGRVTANLIESVQKFRWVAGAALDEEGVPLGAEYLAMVEDGVIAAQYIRDWEADLQEAVLLAPAYTFLMGNRPVDVQIWLDVGGRGWSERLYQPLTHPYVLSREWEIGRIWNDEDEVRTTREALYRLVIGLLRRCRQRVILGLSELSEQGYEHRGPLLRAFQQVLQRATDED